jgi:hypothetical protein
MGALAQEDLAAELDYFTGLARAEDHPPEPNEADPFGLDPLFDHHMRQCVPVDLLALLSAGHLEMSSKFHVVLFLVHSCHSSFNLSVRSRLVLKVTCLLVAVDLSRVLVAVDLSRLLV